MNRVLFILLLSLPQTLLAWQTLEKGFERKAPASGIHLFRVDPTLYRIDLLTSAGFDAAALPTASFREKSRAMLVINGGFFDENFRPIGLVVRNGASLNPLTRANLGIFQVRPGGVASIIHERDWSGEGVETALQVGPRLVIAGATPKFKKEMEPHRRSAVGITKEGKILIALSNSPISIQEWAELLRKEAPYALNLDGGGSSQISVKFKNFSLEVPGATGIPTALAVLGQPK